MIGKPEFRRCLIPAYPKTYLNIREDEEAFESDEDQINALSVDIGKNIRNINT